MSPLHVVAPEPPVPAVAPVPPAPAVPPLPPQLLDAAQGSVSPAAQLATRGAQPAVIASARTNSTLRIVPVLSKRSAEPRRRGEGQSIATRSRGNLRFG